MLTMKLPVPTKGSRMWTPLSPRERAEFFLQDFFDAAHHEVDDGLRRVDDAVGVGFFGGISLEEALVDFVEKVLLFGEAGGVFGAYLDGLVETVERAQEFVSIEGPLGQFDNDLFDFDGYYVAAGEIGVVENSGERCVR